MSISKSSCGRIRDIIWNYPTAKDFWIKVKEGIKKILLKEIP